MSEGLSLPCADAICGRQVATLAPLSDLRELVLRGSCAAVTAKGLRTISHKHRQLTQLELFQCGALTKGAKAIARLTGLTSLRLTQVTVDAALNTRLVHRRLCAFCFTPHNSFTPPLHKSHAAVFAASHFSLVGRAGVVWCSAT